MLKIGVNHIIGKIGDGVSEEELGKIFDRLADEAELDMLSVRGIRKANKRWSLSSTEPSYLEYMGLPRSLPENLDLSHAVVIFGENEIRCRVFIYKSGSLYHAFDTPRIIGFQGRNGYAAIDGKLLFVQDFFQNFYKNYSSSDPCLEVSRLDLKTKAWEPNFSKLNGQKSAPTVFVYKKKVYVISSNPICPPYKYTMIECFDPLESTWSSLPNPPVSTYVCPYMLDTTKGILLCSVRDDDDDLTEDMPSQSLYQLELTSRIWKYHSPLPNFYTDIWKNAQCNPNTPASFEAPIPPNASYIFGLPPDLMIGCTVENFLFCYDTELTPNVPLIVVYDVSGQGDDHVVDCKINLSEILNEYDVPLPPLRCHLTHLQGYEFCLVSSYFTRTQPIANAVCILTFELDRVSATQSDATAHLPKQPKADKSSFILRPLECRRFQLPLDLTLSFCKKMEE